MKKLLVSVLALLAVTAAFAVPGSFKASTGGLLLPSAKIAEATTVSTQLYYSDSDGDDYCAFDNLQIVLPVGQFVEGLDNLEVSARYDFVSDRVNEFTFGAKYVLPLELENISIAVGGQYASELNYNFGPFFGQTKNAYVAATYDLGETLPLSITAGAVYDFYLERIQYGAGAEYDFGVAQAGLEYYSLNYASGWDSSAISIYATADLYKGLGATASYSFFDDLFVDNLFVAGLKYTF